MNPLYKVVLVEDEIVTREGIRDNVNWNAHGFQFSGDAADGEMALSLLETTRPDVLITDIKMPFMDGLQLCKIIRERMPWIKIVILSGHDEFEYAHEAIKLGVKEYLLKPITVENLHKLLDKMGKLLETEREEQQRLRQLQDQVAENQAILKERFLLKLVIGAVNSGEAIEESKSFGLDLVARYYLVALIKVDLADRSEQFDYDEYIQVQKIVSGVVGSNPDIFLLQKDWQEFVLLIKGNTSEYLEEERDLIIGNIKRQVNETRYQMTVGRGTPKSRIAFIYQSFIESLENLKNASNENEVSSEKIDKTLLLKLDSSAVENYLKSGIKEEVGPFIDRFIQPLGETVYQSQLVKNYIFMNVVLSTAKFVQELGGSMDQAVSEFNVIEKILLSINTIEQLREQMARVLLDALVFRDALASGQYASIIKQVKDFIKNKYMNPNLSLNEVAAQVNLSSNHLSVIFSHENNLGFKEYLTDVRIQKAKELLRSTTLGATEIASLIGYNDPHYFSYAFKKNTGMSPTEFRLQSQNG
jgi:two-component system response regulator YesN